MTARSYELFRACCSDYLLKAPTSIEPVPTTQQKWQNATDLSSERRKHELPDKLRMKGVKQPKPPPSFPKS